MKLTKIQLESAEQRESLQERWSPAPLVHVDERWNEFKIGSKNIVSRSHHTSVIHNGTLYVYGGYNTDKGVLSDFQALDVDSSENFRWKELSSNKSNYPGKLRNHSAVTYNNIMVIFGGQNGQNRGNNNIWVFDFVEETWSIRQPNVKVPHLDSHAIVTDNNKMYIFGGFMEEQAVYSNILYCIDLETFQWTILSNNNSEKIIPPRGNTSMVLYDDQLWIFGGIDSKSTYNDFWQFDLKRKEWNIVKSKNTPEPRRSHSMIVYQNCFWMFGGIQDVTKEKNDINIFTPATGQWTRIMNTSNLVYECSPTMKSKQKINSKRKSPTKKESGKPSNKISLISADTNNNVKANDAMKRILQENKHKKFMERKNQLLKQFTQKSNYASKRQLSPISESMLKTLQLIGDQQPNRKILHGEITYDSTNRFIIGRKPCARDAHTCLLHRQKMIIFGGDRHLMCFSDLYYFDLKKGIQSKILYQRQNVLLKKL